MLIFKQFRQQYFAKVRAKFTKFPNNDRMSLLGRIREVTILSLGMEAGNCDRGFA